MIIETAIALIGLYLILKGSEWITDAAVPLAKFLDTTYIAVGLVLVSVLLSLPELIVSLSAVAKGHAGIGIGVIIGSIIVNLGLIIGISAIMRPLKVPRHVVTRDTVFMVVATMVVSLIAFEDSQVTARDGTIFLLLFIPYLVNIYEQEKTLAMSERRKESDMITKTLQFTGKLGGAEVVIHDSRVIFLVGAAMLIAGAELFTSTLITFAGLLGISDLFIGLTIGALGPSIPNLAAAIQAVKRGYDELAISETVGSNIFTLLVTLGILAIFQPFSIDTTTAMVTAPALLIVTVTFFIFTTWGVITRAAGFTLVTLYLLTLCAEYYFRIGI